MTLFDRLMMLLDVAACNRDLGNQVCKDCYSILGRPTQHRSCLQQRRTYWLMLMTSLMLNQPGRQCLAYTEQSYHSSVKRGSQALSKAMPP